MQFEVTKEWKQLPFSEITISFPHPPGMEISSSNDPNISGVMYGAIVKSFYSPNPLYIRIPQKAQIERVSIKIENFI